MSAPAHIAGSIFMLGMGIGACWLIYVHLRAYGDQIIAALTMEAR